MGEQQQDQRKAQVRRYLRDSCINLQEAANLLDNALLIAPDNRALVHAIVLRQLSAQIGAIESQYQDVRKGT